MAQNDIPEFAIRHLLVNDAAITAVTGTQIYPLFTPQNRAKPFIVYSLISQLPERHLESASTLQHCRVQIDGYVHSSSGGDDPYLILKLLMNNVRLALDGFRGNITLSDGDTIHVDSLSLTDGNDIMIGPHTGGDVPLLQLSADYEIGSQLTVPTHP